MLCTNRAAGERGRKTFKDNEENNEKYIDAKGVRFFRTAAARVYHAAVERQTASHRNRKA